MPQTEVDVSCPGCNAVFSVPVELCGEMAECTECSAVFEIPRIAEVPPTLNTDTGAIKGIPVPPPPAPTGESNSSAATNTVKLSRASIGMIPSLKDSFTLGQNASVELNAPPPFSVDSIHPPAQPPGGVASMLGATPPPQQTIPQAQPKLTFTKLSAPPPPPPAKPVMSPVPQTASPRTTSSTHASVSGQQVAQAVMLPAWTKIQLKDGEELEAFRDASKNSVLTAALSSLPILLTIVAMFLAKTQLLHAVVLVILLWIVTLIIALMIAKERTRRAVILTNQRTICIIGKERIELKK